MNAQEKKAFADFKAHCAKLAEKNEDEWKVTMTTDEDGHHIEIIETADRHTFTDGHGSTVQEAIDDAMKNIPEALESWGYENV
jgi:hypothetical protein